jgi:hypothetical protein
MRELTKKQKKLLDQWWKDNEPSKEAEILFNKTNPLGSWEDLTLEQQEALEKINDTEILCQEVNSYLWDKRFENVG